MHAIIVDIAEWVPKESVLSALVRRQAAEASRVHQWIEDLGREVEDPVILAERVVFLSPGEEKSIIYVRDQIATLDPALTEVRDEAGGFRFPDMSECYIEDSRKKVVENAGAIGAEVRAGCVVGVRAPQLLTPAERIALRRLGGDATCRRMHLETRWAAAAGRKVLGLGVGTDVADCDVRNLIASLLRS